MSVFRGILFFNLLCIYILLVYFINYINISRYYKYIINNMKNMTNIKQLGNQIINKFEKGISTLFKVNITNLFIKILSD